MQLQLLLETKNNTVVFTKVMYVFIVLLFFPVRTTIAQIDTLHYIPPIFGVGALELKEYEIILTTLEEEPFEVTVTNGNGTFSETVQISRTAPQSVIPQIGGKKLGLILADDDTRQDNDTLSPLYPYLNKVYPEHGLICRGERFFFANLIYKDKSQGEVLTSKGTVGFGSRFYSGHMHSSHSGDIAKKKSHFISVMAIEDNTTVTFRNDDMLFLGQNSHTFNVTLDAGESYIIGNSLLRIGEKYGTSTQFCNGYNGTIVTSSGGDIVVNSGSFHGGYDAEDSEKRDVGFDQIVPIEYAGQEFILVEGNGAEANADNEVAIVVATEAATTVSVNGKNDSANIWTLENEGDYVIIPREKYTDNSMYISTDKKVYVYQTLAGGENPVTPGMMFIPRLLEGATKEINIAKVSKIGKLSLYLVTGNGAEVTVNGIAIEESMAKSVEGKPEWVAYRINDVSSFTGKDSILHVISTDALNGAVTFVDNNVGGGGYYSGFSPGQSFAGIGTIGIYDYTLRCNHTLDLLAVGGVAYEWSSRIPEYMALTSRENDSTYIFTPDLQAGTGPFVYDVLIDVMTVNGIRKDTATLSITVTPIDTTFGGNKTICYGESLSLNGDGTANKDDHFYSWTPEALCNNPDRKSPTVSPASTTTFNVTFDDGHCFLKNSVTVTVENCNSPGKIHVNDGTTAAGEPFTLHAAVSDSDGIELPENGDYFSWKIIPPSVNGDSLTTDTGTSVTFSGTQAFRTVHIAVRYENPERYPGIILSDTAAVTVIPGQPAQVVMERFEQSAINEETILQTADSTTNAAPLTSIAVEGDRACIYAVTRDAWGNFTGLADNARWQVVDNDLLSVQGTADHKHEGVIQRIMPGSSFIIVNQDDLVSDTVSVKIHASPVDCAEIITRDLDGNGYLDALELHFDSLTSLSEDISDVTLHSDSGDITAETIHSNSGEDVDSIFFITLQEPDSGALQTGWTLTLNGTIQRYDNNIQAGEVVFTDRKTTDGAGPVISRAILYPSLGQQAGDTVVAYVSEPLLISETGERPVSSVFNFYHGTSADQTVLMYAEFDEPTYVQYMRFLVPPGLNGTQEIVPNEDSLQLAYPALDSSGNNAPDASIARKTGIELGGSNAIAFYPLSNPFSPTKDIITAETRTRYGNAIPSNVTGGTIIVLHTRFPLMITDGSAGSVTIYDAVGNLVDNSPEIKQGNTSREFVIHWSGVNRNGRIVGNGTYLLLVKVTDNTGTTFQNGVKVGIIN